MLSHRRERSNRGKKGNETRNSLCCSLLSMSSSTIVDCLFDGVFFFNVKTLPLALALSSVLGKKGSNAENSQGVACFVSYLGDGIGISHFCLAVQKRWIERETKNDDESWKKERKNRSVREKQEKKTRPLHFPCRSKEKRTLFSLSLNSDSMLAHSSMRHAPLCARRSDGIAVCRAGARSSATTRAATSAKAAPCVVVSIPRRHVSSPSPFPLVRNSQQT